MIAIVTGGLGFIGSHLVDLLVEKNHRVFVIDNLSGGDEKYRNNNAEYLIQDILNKKFLSDFIEKTKPDWVFHLAALPRIQPSFETPEEHDDVNVRGTLNIIKVTKNIPIKALVYSSSSSVYGNPKIYPTPESEKIDPLSPYALQKYSAERYTHIFGQRLNIPVVSLRYFNVYGPRSLNQKNPYNAYTSVVGIFNNQKKLGKTLTIAGDGKQERDFVHVRDIAKANLFVAENIEKTRNKVFNVGTSKKISILNLARKIGHDYKFIPERKGEARITHADITELNNLGWQPSLDVDQAILSNDI